jgi:predicted RNase H-related nuclease YkuK (DUF458 family)
LAPCSQIGSGASFFHNNNQARKMGKQLKQMEESILRLEEAQAIEQIKNQEKFKNKDLNAEFSPAAQKQIADLQKQLAEITKSWMICKIRRRWTSRSVLSDKVPYSCSEITEGFWA